VKLRDQLNRGAGEALRLGRTVRGIQAELGFGLHVCADRASVVRYALDVLGYRALRLVNVGPGRRRRIRLASGVELSYRFNRGDIRAIAEIWQLEIYRLPPGAWSGTLVDLGANIGIASVYLANRYHFDRVLAVEPDAGNAAIARDNLNRNGIRGQVVEAAVGGDDGFASFAQDVRTSTLGRIAGAGRQVRLVSMPTLLDQLPAGTRVDVLKIDVEGSEAAIFAAEDLAWLDRVGLIVAELHPNLIAIEPVIRRLAEHGFEYMRLDVHPPDWLFGDLMAIFARRETAAEAPGGQRVTVPLRDGGENPLVAR
jgi:FkbM family methyltransferase